MDKKIDTLKLDKYQGALLGAAIGDALGWPNEQNSNKIGKAVQADTEMFQKWSRRVGGKFWSHDEEINPGEYSDDTQLILATARSLRYGSNWSRYFTKVEIPSWLSYERGGGGATKRAAEVWKNGGAPWKLEKNNINDVQKYFDAGGNGVAMRILPHVFGNEDKLDAAMYQVVLNGIYTHGHPRALLGATLYADALICLSNHSGTLGYGELVSLLMQRKDIWSQFPKNPRLEEWISNANTFLNARYMDLWETTVKEVLDLLTIAQDGLNLGALDTGNDILQSLGCFDKRKNGAGTVTAVAAIYISSKYASNPHIGLVEAANLTKADTDTLASMVGGLLGMLHGTQWISPQWLGIQDREFVKNIVHCTELESEKEFSHVNQNSILDSSNQLLKNKLKLSKAGDTFNLLPFNILTVSEKKLNKANTKGISVYTVKLISEEGQSIFIKTFEKASEKWISPEEEDIVKTLHELEDTNEVKKVTNDKESNASKSSLKDSTSVDKTINKVVINANCLRSFANVLPERMPTDQYLFLISDIMIELERAGTGNLDEKSLSLLKERWHRYDITNYAIERIVRILLSN